MINAQTKLCLIIGDPVNHSLSPVMHNTAYQKIGLGDQFVFLASRVKPQQLKSAIQAVKTLNLRGLSCTIPHKTAVIPLLDKLHPLAKKIGAVNTVVNQNHQLTGYNTDCFGAMIALEKHLRFNQQKVAVLGAGGAARAIAFGLVSQNLSVTIFNRTLKKAQALAQQAGCQAQPLTRLSLIEPMDIIINATSVGMMPDQHRSLLPKKFIQPHHLVFDIVYSPYKTKLLKDAQSQGAKIIPGLDMLLYQAVAQFKLYTHKPAPLKTMRQVLIKHLKIET